MKKNYIETTVPQKILFKQSQIGSAFTGAFTLFLADTRDPWLAGHRKWGQTGSCQQQREPVSICQKTVFILNNKAYIWYILGIIDAQNISNICFFITLKFCLKIIIKKHQVNWMDFHFWSWQKHKVTPSGPLAMTLGKVRGPVTLMWLGQVRGQGQRGLRALD